MCSIQALLLLLHFDIPPPMECITKNDCKQSQLSAAFLRESLICSWYCKPYVLLPTALYGKLITLATATTSTAPEEVRHLCATRHLLATFHAHAPIDLYTKLNFNYKKDARMSYLLWHSPVYYINHGIMTSIGSKYMYIDGVARHKSLIWLSNS